MDYIDRLCDIYTRWLEKENIEPDSAHSILHGEILQKSKKEWLERFVRVWKKQKQKTKSKRGLIPYLLVWF